MTKTALLFCNKPLRGGYQVEKEYQVMNDGAFIIKAQNKYIVEELAGNIESKDAYEYFQQAEQFSNNGSYTEAIRAFEKSLAKHPTMSALLNMSNVLFITDNYALAYNTYHKGLGLAMQLEDKWSGNRSI